MQVSGQEHEAGKAALAAVEKGLGAASGESRACQHRTCMLRRQRLREWTSPPTSTRHGRH